MSTVNNQKLYTRDEKAALAMAAEDEHKPAEQRSGSERRVCTSPGIASLTDNTKRFKLSSNSHEQTVQESPEMLQQKTRKTSGPLVTTEEKRKKGVFGIQFNKSKKEKAAAQEKVSSTTTNTKNKVEPAVANQADNTHAKTTQTEILRTSPFHWGKLLKNRGNHHESSIISLPIESSVDYSHGMSPHGVQKRRSYKRRKRFSSYVCQTA